MSGEVKGYHQTKALPLSDLAYFKESYELTPVKGYVPNELQSNKDNTKILAGYQEVHGKNYTMIQGNPCQSKGWPYY